MTTYKDKNTGCVYYIVTDDALPEVKMRGIPLDEYTDLELIDIIEIILYEFEKANKKEKLEWDGRYKEVIDTYNSRNTNRGYGRFYLQNKLYGKT